jgi:dihydrofolate synthase/folylpolyglutamate synthase
MSAPTGSDRILERMMALHPKIIDLTLDRVWRLLSALDHPERKLAPVIHIAGTNGKGSSQAMFRAGLEAAGKRVCAYTSPHLARFHERIRLPDGLISEPELEAVLAECEIANDGVPITYFEITTVAALLAFSRAQAEYTLLEVGLGGRLDATNVVDKPALTVITPVSLDHQQFLGDAIEAIAGEKAGIIKPDVPCVVNRQDDAALAVIEARAEALGAPLIVAGRDFDIWEERGRMVYQDLNGLMDLPLPSLIGAHQVENAGAVIAGLRHLGFEDAIAEAAVTRAHWPARMQRLLHGPLVAAAGAAELWLDGGHNPAAGEAMAEALSRLPHRKTYAICGMLNTKDITGFLSPLKPHIEHLHAVSIPGETATLTAERTTECAQEAGIPADPANSVRDAICRITSVDPNARIVICGSLYLAGNVLRKNG